MNPLAAADCIGSLLTILCQQPVLPREWPSAKIIHVPPGFIELAPASARERWLIECRPTSYRDRYGVTRWIYSRHGCEYGP
jgi:hypothetical protein